MQRKILKFTAPWCGPCQTIVPFIDDLKRKFSVGQDEFQEINVDEHQDMVGKYEISSIPTFVLVVNNEVVRSVTGVSKHDIQDLFRTMNQISDVFLPTSIESTVNVREQKDETDGR